MATKRAKRIAVGAGAGILTAAALAAAGAYLLSDKKRRAQAKVWVAKARKEVAKTVKSARRMSATDYRRIVDRATQHYARLNKVDRAELAKVATDMKSEWEHLKKNAQKLSGMLQKGSAKQPKRKRVSKRRSRKTTKKTR